MINNYALTVKGRHKHLKQMNGKEETNETDEKYMIQNEEEKKIHKMVSSRSDPTNEKAVNVRHCNTT